jgi:non-ribosomal peptide synthetase component F
MMIGLLGILKAGGAYVPLDPTYPRARLAFMIEDSGARVILTQSGLVELISDGSGRTLVCLDTDWETIAGESADALTTGVTSSDLAYVIYTSGSTGKPKGVMVCHRNVVNFFER